MKALNHRALVRARHALYWARQHMPAQTSAPDGLAEQVRTLIAGSTVRFPSLPPQPLPVTLISPVTMAVLPQTACRDGEKIVVRGFDENGRAGFMVLQPGHQPFHSFSSNPAQAAQAARAAAPATSANSTIDSAFRPEPVLSYRQTLDAGKTPA